MTAPGHLPCRLGKQPDPVSQNSSPQITEPVALENEGHDLGVSRPLSFGIASSTDIPEAWAARFSSDPE